MLKPLGKRAVTLIEILVSLGILTIIAASLYSVFTISLRGWKKSNNILEASTIARVALDRMTREMKNAIIKTDNTFYCKGYDSPSGLRSNSKAHEFYFIAALDPVDSNGESDLCEVGYWVSDQGTAETSDDSLYRLCARQGASTSFDFDFSTALGSTIREFVTNVTDLQFVYYDSLGNSSNIWDSRVNGIPSRIDITISVEVGKGGSSTNPDFVKKSYTTSVSFLTY